MRQRRGNVSKIIEAHKSIVPNKALNADQLESLNSTELSNSFEEKNDVWIDISQIILLIISYTNLHLLLIEICYQKLKKEES